ncbi:MAG: phosphoribosyltransferase [Flavobacteriales bacterium]|nr:phosphoribosyltransferase [Flavobacteriales bacterium]|tara:strand:+ start:7875 stop:8381 length:507 start_codon:yes stop_codon:yes gene_type:complete
MKMNSSTTLVLNAQQMEQKLCRMAWEVLEKNHQESHIVIAGISPKGSILAQRLSKHLSDISSISVEVIEVKLDKVNPLSSSVQVSAHSELNNKVIVLVDDVLNSGKTLMYGAQYFLNQPIKKLMTAILIDRNYKNYPIKADVVGLSLATTLQEHVNVDLGKKEAVYLN